MNIKESIEKFVPFNDQEQYDKEVILKCIETFDDVLTRVNKICHFTCSAFILNKNKDKVLMIHHNIYNSWAWVGGHADGEDDFLCVALREIEEETGLKNVKPIYDDIYAIDVAPIKAHIRKGKYVGTHLHLSVVYLMEADEGESLTIKADENSNVKWIPINDIVSSSEELHMRPIYQKIIDKLAQK